MENAVPYIAVTIGVAILLVVYLTVGYHLLLGTANPTFSLFQGHQTTPTNPPTAEAGNTEKDLIHFSHLLDCNHH